MSFSRLLPPLRSFIASQKGFTLLELLTVIAIMGLLAAVIITALGRPRMSAQDKARLTTVFQLQNALETYYANYYRYPSGLNFTGWNNGNAISDMRGQNNCFDPPATTVRYCNDDSGRCVCDETNSCSTTEQPDSTMRFCRDTSGGWTAPHRCQNRYDAIYELERRGYLPANFFKDPVQKEGTIGVNCSEGNPSSQSEGFLGSGPPCDLNIVYCSNDPRNACGDRYEWMPGFQSQRQRYVIGTNITTGATALDQHGNYQIYEGGQRDTYLPRCVNSSTDCNPSNACN